MQPYQFILDTFYSQRSPQQTQANRSRVIMPRIYKEPNGREFIADFAGDPTECDFNIFRCQGKQIWGVRQDRVLSFDSRYICNSKPRNFSGFLDISSKVKHPQRSISSLRYIDWDPNSNQKCFTLAFQDETLNNEAKVTVVAQHIVKRLDYLNQIKNCTLQRIT